MKPKAVLRIKSANDFKAIATLGRQVVFNLSKHSDLYPNPNPSLKELKNAVDLLESLIVDASRRSHTKIADRNDQTKLVHNYLRREVLYVNQVGDGDTCNLLLSGFKISKKPARMSLPGKVVIKSIRPRDEKGQAKIDIMKVKNAQYYQIAKRRHNDSSAKWILVGSSSSMFKIIVTDLTHGEDIDLRVVAGNTRGLGQWSEPHNYMVQN